MTTPADTEWDDEPADDDPYCDCGSLHTVEEIDSGVCGCCGKPISCEEYS